jgi:hypothetical protein
VKLPDNFQIREHSWPCLFHIIIFFNVNRSFIENSAPNLYLLWIVYINCQNGGVLGGNGGGLFRNQ